MFSFLRNLFSLFDARERWQLIVLTLALILRAFVELVGVASIAPFMAVVADPGEIQRNPILQAAYNRLEFSNSESFLFYLGLTVITLLVVSNAFGALTQWALLKFSWNTNHRLSLRMMDGYLKQPYAFFTHVNSAKLSNSILSEVQQVINGIVIPTLTVASRLLVVLALIGLLVWNEPLMAAAIVMVLGSAYGTLYLVIRARQRVLGLERVAANRERFKVTNEAFGGIKDVKVLGRESSFLRKFRPASLKFSTTTASNSIVSQLPRYLFETIAFSGMILIVLYSLNTGRELSRILPMLSLYAFAGYRLLPELQQMFAALSNVRFTMPALESLLADLAQFGNGGNAEVEREVEFRQSIRFDRVSFQYPTGSELALNEVILEIPRNQSVGLVGSSGSGKTTLVDLLLGLYTPTSGQILIDNQRLDSSTTPRWRQLVGYVPQHIFLCDDTLVANIAFGVPEKSVDFVRVVAAAKMANLDAFITSLPEKYGTIVGERGVRLSGGQRQRIGIARALYHDPQVLVMDEATSALDGATENAVMEAINELAGKKTILLIAHRLTTVERCDKIIVLQNGRAIAEGNFEDLSMNVPEFQRLSGAMSNF